MKKSELKGSIDQLRPDDLLEKRLEERIKQRVKERGKEQKFRGILSIAASLVAALCLCILGYFTMSSALREDTKGEGAFAGAVDQGKTDAQSKPATKPNGGMGVYIPQMVLPDENNSTAEVAYKGAFYYKGRIYIHNPVTIDSQIALGLKGEKVGTTVSSNKAWQNQGDTDVNLASTMPGFEIFTVKGYDSSFRLMSFKLNADGVWADFYECINNVTLGQGADLFSRLRLEGRVESGQFQTYENWNNGGTTYEAVEDLETINKFISDLMVAKPIVFSTDKFSEEGQGFIYLTLKDKTRVQLRLFKDQMVYYSLADIFFKVDGESFNKLWKLTQ